MDWKSPGGVLISLKQNKVGKGEACHTANTNTNTTRNTKGESNSKYKVGEGEACHISNTNTTRNTEGESNSKYKVGEGEASHTSKSSLHLRPATMFVIR